MSGPIVGRSEVLRQRAGREEAGEEGRNGRGETGGDKDGGEGGRKSESLAVLHQVALTSSFVFSKGAHQRAM